jgi:hypothetical protein
MRWTISDTIGFIVAAIITTLPPLVLVGLLEWHNPSVNPPPPPNYSRAYLVALIGLSFAAIASAVAWRWGGSPNGRWLMHAGVASGMLASYLMGCCVWLWLGLR